MSSIKDLSVKEKGVMKDFFEKKGLPLDIDLTFEDVALPDEYSDIRSRSEINDFSVSLADGLKLNIPLVGANMRSIMGADLIVALEREGGVGIPPQDLLLSERLHILERVLRAESAVIDDPLTINPGATMSAAKKVMARFGVSGLLVVNRKGTLIGILSSRDWRYEENGDRRVHELMTSAKETKLITAPKKISLEEAKRILRENKIEKLPLVTRTGKVTGLITARGLFYPAHYPRALRDERGRFVLVGSVGVKSQSHGIKDLLKEIHAQRKKGIRALLVETARAYAVNAEETIKTILREHPDLPLISGNTSNPRGVKFLFDLGVQCVKVGQGPGFACTTREVGTGVPQLTAVAMASVIAREYQGHIIADGGISGPGDVAKALIAGADAVMIGKLFAGTNESRSPTYPYYSKEFGTYITAKDYYGSASFEAQWERQQEGTLREIRRPEGRKETLPVIGPASYRINDLLDGLRSVMSYFGARSVKELKEKGYFRRQSREGFLEGVKR